MKIKEVERKTGITSANIRFYEKEGLLVPSRNQENNYGDYTEQDIWRIQRIKMLRMIGISIAEIKELFDGRKSLEEIIQKRMNLEMLSEDMFAENKNIWTSRRDELLHRDIVKEMIFRKALNRNLGSMLFIGMLMNAMVAFMFGDYFIGLKSEGWISVGRITFRSGEHIGWQMIVLVVISIICTMMIYFTTKAPVLMGTYIVVAATLTPLLLLRNDRFPGRFSHNQFCRSHLYFIKLGVCKYRSRRI